MEDITRTEGSPTAALYLQVKKTRSYKDIAQGHTAVQGQLVN